MFKQLFRLFKKPAREEKKPYRWSPEGIVMLSLAALFELGFSILAFLDVAFFIGTFLAFILNAVAFLFLGGWLILRTGKFPKKKILIPLGLNAIPVVRAIPFFWPISIWGALSDVNEAASPQKTAPKPKMRLAAARA